MGASLAASAGSPDAADEKRSVETHRVASVDSRSADGSRDPEKGTVLEEEEAAAAATAAATRDPNVVDFDGLDDPENPLGWSKKKKWSMIMCLSIMTLVTPLASSMFAPGVPEVMRDFRSDSSTLGAFVVSVFILGYAAGPMAIAPLSEMYGRLWVYHVCNVLFVVFSIACAVSTTLNMLIAFRFFAGVFGSACITMGGGTIADMFIQEERGAVMALWSIGPLLGPVIGPIAGGFIANSIGWRWVFWIITIVSALITGLYFVFVRESYAPVLLKRKAARLRTETGNADLRGRGETDESTAQLFARCIVRPLKLLFLSPIVFLLSLYCAVCYGYLYLLFTTLTSVFLLDYHFSAGTVGLTYIGIGVGMMLSLAIVGAMSDRILRKKAAGGEMKPEYRLPPMVPGALAIPVGLFVYGWSAQYRVFWFVPILGTACVGFGLIGIFMAANTYLIDAFTLHAASAIAANAILRSLLGALLPLAGPAMYSTLGLGWGNSLLGFVAVALLFIPFVFLRYGEFLRTNPRFQVKL